MIEAEKATYTVERMCELLEVSRSGYGGFWQSSQHVPSRAESLVRVERSGVGSVAGAGTGRHAHASRALRVPAGPACGRPLTRGTLRPWGRELRAGRWPCPPQAPAASCPGGGSFRISAESLRGEQVADLLDGFAVAEAFSGPVVEFGGDLVQLGFAVHGQVAALRKYWRSRPLVFSFVPRCQGLCGSQK